MSKPRSCAAFVTLLMLAACATPVKKPLVDRFPLRFPLIEAGSLEIEGHIVGQPRAGLDIVCYATQEGYATAVVVPSRSVFWRFKADHSISASIDLAGVATLFRDDGRILYFLGHDGKLIYRMQLDDIVSTPVRVIQAGYVFGTAEGNILALGADGWEHRPSVPGAKVTAGPVLVDGDEGLRGPILFGRSDGLLVAVDTWGKPLWEFWAEGAIQVDPAAAGGHIYFGDSERMFYCLNAATGKVKWRRRLQGAPLHPAVISGGTVVVAASNSVIYLLSARGGSILSWETVPSRVVYELAAAGPLVLVSSASPDVTAFEIKTGKRVGQYAASGPLVAGAVWTPPYIVLFVENGESGRQKIVFLRSR